MPSIPQSLLWISLVVLWLFVLVPMLVSKRDTVRRTSDVALATRVLNSGRNARLRRPRAAAGHYSDPDWQPAEDQFDGHFEAELDDEEQASPRRSVVLAAAVEENAEPDYLDVDVVDEDSGALPVGDSFGAEAVQDEPVRVQAVQDEPQTDELPLDFGIAESEAEQDAETAPQPVIGAEAAEDSADDDYADDGYEYVDDSSGLEAEAESEPVAESMATARRNRYESKTAQVVSARKYAFRKRMLLGLSGVLMATAVLAFVVTPTLWWACGSVAGVTVLYLAYLRRQTRIEEQLRRRRAQRMMRSRLGVENTADGDYDVVPSRLRRPGAAVLEIDDEDPIFEHLEYASVAREYDLPRAAGQ